MKEAYQLAQLLLIFQKDINEQKRGRPFISQRSDSKGSLNSSKTEDSFCASKRPMIRAYSPENQLILSSPHSPKTFGNAAASSRSPKVVKLHTFEPKFNSNIDKKEHHAFNK